MPRMIDLIRASAVPASLMQAAARGALSLPADEMIEILVHLANHNKVFAEQARMTLAGWDEKASQTVASNPATSKEALDYWIKPENLRPALLPTLIENPALSEETLVQLSSSGSREVVEHMLKSPRVNGSLAILTSLSGSPHLSPAESSSVQEKVEAAKQSVTSSKKPDEERLFVASAEDAAADDVLDPELLTYMATHEKEIAADSDKPFQAIGGFYDDLIPSAAPLATDAAASAIPASESAAAGDHHAVAKKSHLSHGEERGSALQKISRLDVKGRIQLAMKGNKEERSILVRDGTKLVALAVLESPKITDGEVEKIACQKNVLEAVLRFIPMKRRFAKNYIVVRNLVANPRTPLDVSLGLMKHILINDLRNLSGNKEVSETVRKLALKMFKQKLDTSKKTTD